MKKFCLFAIAALLLVVLASCPEPVTPVGYTRYDKSGDEYVFYDSLMALDQIKVYRNKAAFDDKDLYDMTFDFAKCHGRDELDGVSYTAELFPATGYTAEAAFYFGDDGRLAFCFKGAPVIKTAAEIGETVYTVYAIDEAVDEALFDISGYAIS